MSELPDAPCAGATAPETSVSKVPSNKKTRPSSGMRRELQTEWGMKVLFLYRSIPERRSLDVGTHYDDVRRSHFIAMRLADLAVE